MAITGFMLFVFSVGSLGYLLLARTSLSGVERVSTGFIFGATVLPLGLFILQVSTGILPLANNGAGYLVTPTVILGLASVLVWHLTRRRSQSASLSSLIHSLQLAARRLNPLSILLMGSLLVAICSFFWLLVKGLQAPVFGWDEYSYWLYAAKALTLSGGRASVLLSDAYATYPLGFPYLVAWCYHLTGDTAIVTAKLISPLLTLATCITLFHVLKRLGLSALLALCAVAVMLWGTHIFYWYNIVAYGEMSYVDTYTVGILYAVAWLEGRADNDLRIACAVLGLTVFLRVDGFYIDLFTTLLMVLISFSRKHSRPAAKTTLWSLLWFITPELIWKLYVTARVKSQSGWTTRISWHEIMHRLTPVFLQTEWLAVWRTATDLTVYPISLAFAFCLICAWFVRKRSVAFLTLVAAAQIAYLFVAYLTVFSRFEALHASSLDRYLLRIDPLIAVALIFILAPTAEPAPIKALRQLK